MIVIAELVPNKEEIQNEKPFEASNFRMKRKSPISFTSDHAPKDACSFTTHP